MAEVKIITPNPVPKQVVLTLTEEEAQYLSAALINVAAPFADGDDPIWLALRKAGIDHYPTFKYSGSVFVERR